MKSFKNLLVIIYIIFLSSCHKADISQTTLVPDPIWGKWMLTDIAQKGVSEKLNACSTFSYMEFDSNNSVTAVEYEMVEETGTCIALTFKEGTWEIWEGICTN